MQDYVKGIFRQTIFRSDKGYIIGLLKVHETNIIDMQDYVNKTITFTGYFADVNGDDYYKLFGNYVFNERYGSQFQVSSYEREEPKGKDAVIDFLSSSLVKGCGEKTAISIVDALGDNALELIKKDFNNLLVVPGISEVKAKRIYNSIVKYQSTDMIIVELKKLGFTINEALSIINKWGDSSLEIVKNDIYKLIDIIDFMKLDKVFLSLNDANDRERVLACVLESFKRLSFKNGDTYSYKNEIFSNIRNEFKIFITEDEFDYYLNELVVSKYIICEDDKYFLSELYDNECDIADNLEMISRHSSFRISNFDTLIAGIELESGVKYNINQKDAIKNALVNRVSIITGGPGTGKTTIINSLRKLDSKYGFKTFDIPFDNSFEGMAGISSCVPGTLENAAAYIHSSFFALWGLFKIGESDLAWEQFKKLLPITHKFISHSPFVMSNSYMENEFFSINGDSVNDWMTGSATVLLKILMFSICGYQPQLDGILISPAENIPFEDFTFTLETPNYNIKINYNKVGKSRRTFLVNGEEYNLKSDNNKFENIFIPYDSIDNGVTLEIIVSD